MQTFCQLPERVQLDALETAGIYVYTKDAINALSDTALERTLSRACSASS